MKKWFILVQYWWLKHVFVQNWWFKCDLRTFCRWSNLSQFTRFWGDQSGHKYAVGGPQLILRAGLTAQPYFSLLDENNFSPYKVVTANETNLLSRSSPITCFLWGESQGQPPVYTDSTSDNCSHVQDPLIIASTSPNMSSSPKLEWVRQQTAPLLALASILGGILLGLLIRLLLLMLLWQQWF